MSMRGACVVGLAGLTAMIAAAQDGQLGGPVTGLVFDPASRLLRPMLGVPGSAYLSAGLAAAEQAAVSPDGRMVLAFGEARALLGRIDTGGLRWSALGPEAAPERIRWNRASTAAASFEPAARRLVLWRSLDQQPETIVLAAPESGALEALAVESGGDAVLAAFADAVWRIDAGGARLLLRTGRPSALLVGPGERDLYIADGERNEILVIHNYKESPDTVLLAGAGLGIQGPAALALSPDEKLLLIAQSRSLAIWNLAGGAMASQTGLDFDPAHLEPLGGGAVYLLTSRQRAGDVLRVLELGETPAVYFVPAGEVTPSPVEE